MITKERQTRILEMVRNQSFVSVKELMDQLHASRSSIVRDLIELEQQGLLVRERGGASANRVYQEIATEKKAHIHVKEKQCICAQAAKTIKENQCIYIDSGTTTSYMVEHIADKDILLVTSSTYLIHQLPLTFQGQVFLLGGQYDRRLDTALGSTTLEMVSHFHFDHAFLSANGIDLKTQGIYTANTELATFKKAILKQSTQCDLLADASKFEVKTHCTWAYIDDFDTIFVDNGPKYKPFTICQKGNNYENK
ncbi:MAG: DeoR/GlpR family DNA-binding transcription regulator [Absicoccus porci]|uniref:DeoR/GlpR family DNA-binding transcription regulator n=1 Tax=Absicoccus porci TaxID=2486576 RepID=UPI002355F597|nr:DeoR/GlpR family DNA-binding transcription regulator [Absicoccus porci]MCI6087317.1 DeoR/GlpR family DNA-binding transcription regulator [Absicoccus porci]MDD7330483.1 DeoR/GlpR family DNA-binding transcription regulator [Absicoccus porci]MDY4739332.1 DeoR/GlpR family DNA-binding transcription regulator [Absicoccus porci]